MANPLAFITSLHAGLEEQHAAYVAASSACKQSKWCPAPLAPATPRSTWSPPSALGPPAPLARALTLPLASRRGPRPIRRRVTTVLQPPPPSAVIAISIYPASPTTTSLAPHASEPSGTTSPTTPALQPPSRPAAFGQPSPTSPASGTVAIKDTGESLAASSGQLRAAQHFPASGTVATSRTPASRSPRRLASASSCQHLPSLGHFGRQGHQQHPCCVVSGRPRAALSALPLAPSPSTLPHHWTQCRATSRLRLRVLSPCMRTRRRTRSTQTPISSCRRSRRSSRPDQTALSACGTRPTTPSSSRSLATLAQSTPAPSLRTASSSSPRPVIESPRSGTL